MPHKHDSACLYLLEELFGSEDDVYYAPRRVGPPPRPRLTTRIRHWLGLAPPDEPKDFEWD